MLRGVSVPSATSHDSSGKPAASSLWVNLIITYSICKTRPVVYVHKSRD